jgi:DNA repair exonuclease SbcCD ATPase subunit
LFFLYSYLVDLKEIFSEVPPTGNLPENIEETIDEAEQLIGEIKLSLGSISDRHKKNDVATKIRDYQSELEKLKRRLLTQNSGGAPVTTEEARHHQNMDRLRAARAQLADTEAVAQETIENLDRQEEQMRNTNANVSLCSQ